MKNIAQQYKLSPHLQISPGESHDEYYARIYRHARTLENHEEGLTLLICAFITINGDELTDETISQYMAEGMAGVAASTDEEIEEAQEYVDTLLSDTKKKLN